MNTGRVVRKILLVGLGVFTLGLFALGGFAWWAATHPEGTYRLIQRYVFPKDLKITWGEVHFEPRRFSWLHWGVDLKVEQLLVTKGAPALEVPIDEVALRFELTLWRPTTHADFAEITVRASRPITFEPGPSNPADEEDKSPFERLEEYVGYLGKGSKYATVERLVLDVREFRIVNKSSGDVTLALDVRKPPADRPNRVIGLDVAVKSKAFALAVKGEADASRINSVVDPFLTAHVTFEGFKVREKGDLVLNFVNQAVSGTFDGDVSYGSGREVYHLKPHLKLAIDPHHADLDLKTAVSGLPAPVHKLDPVEVHLEVPIDPGRTWSEEASNLKATAPFDLFFLNKGMRANLERACGCKIPERLNVGVDGRVWLAYLTEAPARKKQAAELRIKVDPVHNKLFAIDLAADLGLFREKDEFTYEPKLDAEAHVESYQTVRKMIDAHDIMIPSPFDVLDGRIDLLAKNPVRRDETGTATDVDLRVALGSAHQKIDLRSATTLKLGPTFKSLDVYVKLLIDAFHVQLPPLEPLAGLPPLAHDSRVILTPPKPEEPAKKKPADAFKLQFFFSVKTTSPGSIRLLSDLAKPYVPISVAVDRALNGDLTGNVQLESFQISYLRRVVHVEGFRILMDERDPANFPIDGRIRVDQTNYKVFLDVSGTVKSPSVRLSSEPYLPRNEIISVLLYDRTSDGLVSSDAEAAGSFEAAMADRAIGLFGLWAFASTPIKSFTYNPVTKVYSATVQLSDGLTAGIGTNWEESASFEVRKRVSRRWVLTASWSPSEASHNQVGKLVLQWEKRF